jgi:GH25 family lysozyme M1 (1,4-beta-N-acetylmuramidase)
MKDEVDWVILRVGFGSNYESQDDAQFKNNIEGCEKYGIPYGVYLYSYATTVEKAKSEAEHCIRLLKGHRPTMPVFYDMEEERIRVLGNSKILDLAKTFCNEITKAGYLYGTYCNTNWFTNYLTDKWYDQYPKWLAQYNDKVTYKGTYDIWQYSSTGKINGHKGNFDMNYCYTSFLPGDINLDGKITAADARLALRAASKLAKLSKL